MAGVITHMVIAKEIIKRLPEGTIKRPDLYYLGVLAPDAIHAREGYIREYKKHTHFRDNIMDSDFEVEDNFRQYQERLIAFIHKNRDRNDDLIDMYRGYVVHILTDELFVLTLRKDFCKEMEQQGIGQYDQTFFNLIIGDMNRNDMLLAKNDPEIDKIKKLLEQVPIYGVEGYLSEREMSESRDWLVKKHFFDQYENENPQYISYEKMVSFVHSAADAIVKKLSEEESPFRMF